MSAITVASRANPDEARTSPAPGNQVCPFAMIHTLDSGKLNTEADLLAVIRTGPAYAASLKSVICASNARLKAGLAVQRST
jgi:hypothetical protein